MKNSKDKKTKFFGNINAELKQHQKENKGWKKPDQEKSQSERAINSIFGIIFYPIFLLVYGLSHFKPRKSREKVLSEYESDDNDTPFDSEMIKSGAKGFFLSGIRVGFWFVIWIIVFFFLALCSLSGS